jgi:CMP-N-acetylneuraminic acid synthetase
MKINSEPLITVYITNYNYAKYLEKAIKSVLQQTFQDFQLLIIDDGSTDDSLNILDRYEKHDKVFTVRQSNQGLIRANNVALKLARGKYIMRLDADDYLDPHALEVLVRELERRPECALVFPDYYLVDEEDNIIRQVRRHDFDNDVSLFDQPAHGACTLIRRSVLLRLGGYDEEFRCQDGYDIWLKLISEHKVTNVNLPLFYYRQHRQSLSQNEDLLLHTRAAIKAKHVEKLDLGSIRVLAVLPIRGRTMDPRSFPLAKVGKQGLIDWSLEAALNSKYVTDVLVSTPDTEVQNHVRTNYPDKVLVVDRPKEMARINIPLEPSLLDAVRYYSKENEAPDLLAVLFIEAPFRTAMYIDEAINTMLLYDIDVVDGIREEEDIFYFHDGNGLRPWHLDSGLRLERQSHFRRVGGLHLIRRGFLERERNMLSGRIGHIIFDQRAAFTIRSELDWQIAQFLAQQEM